jgi:hypothetical protein
MNDKKPLFIPNKLRKITQQSNAQIASNYSPEYNRLFDEGKIPNHVEDLPNNAVIKEKLKKEFDSNKSNTSQNSIPRIGSNQELYWNQAIANPQSKNGYYDEELMSQPVYDESLDMVAGSDLKDAMNFTSKPQDIISQRKAALELQAKAQEAAQAVAKAEQAAAAREAWVQSKQMEAAKPANSKQETKSVSQDSELDINSIEEGNLILINSKTSELLMVSEDFEKISSKIEDLLQEDSSLEDFIVLHKLKINVGVTLK